MGNVVEFEVFRDYLGVGATDPLLDDAGKLYDAINAECRRLTGLDFEGDGGATYDQVIRVFGAREFNLPHAPVSSITSLARAYFDGTEDDPFEATSYRLEDATRGRVGLVPDCEYVHAVWAVSGDIPAQAIEAVLEWGRERWSLRDQPASLASYQTGQDAESYSVTLAGRPPRSVLMALLGVSVKAQGGVV